MKRIGFYFMLVGLTSMLMFGCKDDNSSPISDPVVQTGVVTNITEVSATVSGTIDYAGTLTEFGVCWGTEPNPTIATNKMTASGDLNFTLDLTGLTPGTIYYVRAFATYSDGTVYGDQRSFTTDGYPALTLPFVERFQGTEFPPNKWQLIDHDGDGNNWYQYENLFYAAISDSYDTDALTPYNFLISPKIAISGTNPKLEWNIGAAHTVYYDEHYKVVVSTEKITEDNCATIGTIVYEETLTAEEGRTVRNRVVDMSAYAGQDVYIAWIHYDCSDVYALILTDIRIGSNENPVSVTTPAIGSVSLVGDIIPGSTEVSSIISNDGGVSVIDRGFCYSTSPAPTINDNIVEIASNTSNVFMSFSGTLDLDANQTYYVRAFAKNAVGVAYSSDFTIVVPEIVKTVLLNEPFDSDPFSRGWTEIDKDGDGYNWEFYTNPNSITSDSYRGGGVGALTPENYLISPQITIPATAASVNLEFQVAAADDTDYKEQYKVIISEDPITFDNCRDADVLQDFTELTAVNANKTFTNVSIDMTAYKGQNVYVGIVHGNCTDQYFILVRNFSVYTLN